MVDNQLATLSVRRQCELLGLNRASFYYQAASESALNLHLMRLIDEQFLRAPFYGWPKMTAHLRRLGYVVNINRCINEKTDKIKDKHDLYTKWWLILVEHTVHPTVLRQPDELQAVRNKLSNSALWSRITILSSLEGVPHLNLI